MALGKLLDQQRQDWRVMLPKRRGRLERTSPAFDCGRHRRTSYFQLTRWMHPPCRKLPIVARQGTPVRVVSILRTGGGLRHR